MRLAWRWLAAIVLHAAAAADKPPYQHGISLLHDLKYPADFKHFDYADPSAPKGGRLVLSTTAPVRNFSGVRGGQVPNAMGLGRTVDRLLIRSADELSGLYGQLADGVALSADRRTLFVRLNAKARWHDGVPVTTADVRFSYEELLGMVFGKVYLEPWIESLAIINPRELAIHHRDVFTNANLVALTWFPMRPAHYYADRDPRADTLVPPVGSGPYRVAKFDRDYIVYARVDDYWGRDIPVNRGRYNFDEIRYDVYRDMTVAREAFRKGLFDIHFETDVGYWQTSFDIPALRNGSLKKEVRKVRKFVGMQNAIVLNTDREQLDDVRVREALALALDFDWQNRVLHHGAQARASSYFANSMFAAKGLPTAEELAILAPFRDRLPERLFVEPFRLPVSSGPAGHRNALERARDLLGRAGWAVRDGVLVDTDGRPFELRIVTQNAAFQRVLLPYIDSLRQLGITASLQLLDSVLAVNFLRRRDYDAYLRGHEFLNPPLGELESYFASSTADLALGGNLAGIRDPVVDALIAEAERRGTIDAVVDVCRALDRVLLWGFYHIPLQSPADERFLYWDKFGRPDESSAKYEYLVGSSVRIVDSWWAR